jgi:TolB-like protein
MTEELTSEFARYQEFQVIASRSTLQYKGRQVDLKKVGDELGVRFLVTGSVRKDPETIKVTVQLLDAHTNNQIWCEGFKRDLKAACLIELQEEIARKVVGTIADHYGSITRRLCREAPKTTPATLMTYDAVLRFYHYETVLTPEAFVTALSALERAIELDPGYGLAWSMLGHLHADNFALGFCEIEAPLEKALEFAKKGLMIAPENQFAHDALSMVYFHRGDKDQFLKHVHETISLNPNAPYIVGVAGWHLALGGAGVGPS